MKLSRAAWCALGVLALTSIAAVALGSEAGTRIRQSFDDKPVIKTLAAPRLVRVTLDKKAQPMRVAPARRIAASLDDGKVAYVGSGTIKRRFRHTLDDTGYLGDAQKTPKVPTLAFPAIEEEPVVKPKRVFRQSLDDAPKVAAQPRPVRTTLE